MLHINRVLRAVYYATRRRVRLALGLQPRKMAPPVLGQALDKAIERHGALARTVLDNLPSSLDLNGKVACEVGCGDCLAIISLMLGLGARQVEVVEVSDPVVNKKQRELLTVLRERGLPTDPSFIVGQQEPLSLNTQRVRFHKTYMENLDKVVPIDFMVSCNCGEHVEDLDGFYRACAKVMPAGAQMLHVIDLGGHAEFEDPTPPLDFQTYPDWLYNYMYPPYCRATRRFVDEHIAAIERNGFKVLRMNPFRTADPAYLSEIWPKLRAPARSRSREVVQVIEFAVLAQKLR